MRKLKTVAFVHILTAVGRKIVHLHAPPLADRIASPRVAGLSPPGAQREQRIWRPITPLIGRLFFGQGNPAQRQVYSAPSGHEIAGARQDFIDSVKHQPGGPAEQQQVSGFQHDGLRKFVGSRRSEPEDRAISKLTRNDRRIAGIFVLVAVQPHARPCAIKIDEAGFRTGLIAGRFIPDRKQAVRNCRPGRPQFRVSLLVSITHRGIGEPAEGPKIGHLH
jgi:hypothetical protein